VKIDEKEVRYVADLANLRLTEAEVGKISHDMNEILAHMDKLNELETDDVEPMTQVLYDAGETATLREDVEGPTMTSEIALENAPVKGLGYFKVPRVIER
jgi:aspartyl-tRNA(Asn)/glutamyl-tRNA(Gln) amidotransferase subunit C